MNSESESFEELTTLAGQMLDGELPANDLTRLSELIAESEEAHEAFVQFCELHSMLEAEPSILEVLSTRQHPENVVSLPGSKPTASNAEPLRSIAPPSRLRIALLAAAVVIFAGIILYWNNQPSSTVSQQDLAGVPADAENQPLVPEIIEGEPEEQYQRAVLATLGSGSLQRPPTNFSSEPSLEKESISFNRDIRPILSDNCFSCHGPDEHSREGELRLDTPEGVTGGDDPAIIAGDPGASELIIRLNTDDEDDLMPPGDSHKELTADQIELITRWVAEGAVWEGHWSFMAINEDTEPQDFTASIDHFVDARLERKGLLRSPETDQRTLIRRASLDLTGLPPTPEEVNSFLESTSETAYEDLVDDLMSRPTFGEHRARYWLDAARYGDTHGLHLDNYREIWPYRDWVINAFNENMPFDQFTIEQIAGDLLENPTTDQLIATGFNRCNVTTSEGGSIEEEYLVRYAVDRVATTSTVWMGLTTGCAQCHDHKFDPISTKEFYQLFAFFNNTTQAGMDGNIPDTPPVIRLYDSQKQEEEAKRLKGDINKLTAKAKKMLNEDSYNHLKVEEVAPEFFSKEADSPPTNLGNIAGFGKGQPFSVSFRAKLPDREGRFTIAQSIDPENNDRGWRIYWEDRGFVVELIESFPEKVLKRGYTRKAKEGYSGHFAFTYDGSGSSRGISLYLNGVYQANRFQIEWLDTVTGDFSNENADLIIGGTGTDSEGDAQVSEFTIFDRTLADTEIKSLSIYTPSKGYERKAAHVPAPKKGDKTEQDAVVDAKKAVVDAKKFRSADEELKLKTFVATFSDGPYQNAIHKISALKAQLSRIESATPTTLVMAETPEGTPKAHLLMRGEYDQKGDEVTPAFPSFFPEIGEDLPMNRLGLAQWLVHEDHPLTARVTANRIWQELFGIGLVKTAEDFGTQGESPSHPKLLDWLASQLIASDWDVKDLYRTIMLSETYRQSSIITGDFATSDPDNRLLARGPRFRLDAEVIRDQALFASGLLNTEMGGRSAKPYQPGGIWKSVGYTNSNTQSFFQDYGSAAENRRAIYSFWKRTAHQPNLAIFDAPNRESCVMRRERTNTPLQALVLMNDPQFVRAARHLAFRVVTETDDRDDRLDKLAELLRAKPLTSEERQIVVNSLDQFQNIYESDVEAADKLLIDEVNPTFSLQASEENPSPELATWTMVASQMLNLDEVINKN